MLLVDKINEKTSIIKTFSQNEAAAKKSAEQKKIDSSYRETINSVKKLTSEVVNNCQESNFMISDSIKNQFSELMDLCLNSTNKGRVEVFDTNSIVSKVKEVRSSLQYEWERYYAEETASVEEVLAVIKGLANVNVSNLLLKMKAAKNWNTDVNVVIDMMDAIKQANTQIESMKLTDTTVEFLKKVIDKKATLEDLTEEVVVWLKKEGIMNKVKISF